METREKPQAKSPNQGPALALPSLREVIAQYGLQAQKSLGQNFLHDVNAADRIARIAGPLEACTVYEVGPGPGALTRALLRTGARHIVAVEKDHRCHAALLDLAAAYPGRLSIMEGDALQLDEAAFLKQLSRGGDVKIIANLPYNISTVLLVKWLKSLPWPPWFSSLTLMFQKEVADRLAASPSTKAYGRLSILTQWRLELIDKFDLPRDVFVPKPKITSTVMHFAVKPSAPDDPHPDTMEKITRAAFGQRRKKLRSSLKNLNAEMSQQLFERAGVDPSLRAEDLSVQDYCRLAVVYEAGP